MIDAVGQEAIVVSVERAAAGASLWCVFDNARLAALDALWIAEKSPPWPPLALLGMFRSGRFRQDARMQRPMKVLKLTLEYDGTNYSRMAAADRAGFDPGASWKRRSSGFSAPRARVRRRAAPTRACMRADRSPRFRLPRAVRPGRTAARAQRDPAARHRDARSVAARRRLRSAPRRALCACTNIACSTAARARLSTIATAGWCATPLDLAAMNAAARRLSANTTSPRSARSASEETTTHGAPRDAERVDARRRACLCLSGRGEQLLAAHGAHDGRGDGRSGARQAAGRRRRTSPRLLAEPRSRARRRRPRRRAVCT